MLHVDRPVACVDVALCLSFSFWSVSFMLGRSGADGSSAGAHAAWSSRVSFNSRVPVSTAAARHWNTQIVLSGWNSPKRATLKSCMFKNSNSNNSSLTIVFTGNWVDGTASALRAHAAPVLGGRGAQRGAVCGRCAPLIIRGWGWKHNQSCYRKKTAGFAKGGFLKVHTNIYIEKQPYVWKLLEIGRNNDMKGWQKEWWVSNEHAISITERDLWRDGCSYLMQWCLKGSPHPKMRSWGPDRTDPDSVDQEHCCCCLQTQHTFNIRQLMVI